MDDDIFKPDETFKSDNLNNSIPDTYNNDDLNFDEPINTGTPIDVDKNTLLKQLFNTDDRSEILRRSLRGEIPKGDGSWIKLPKELAGDLFVNKQIAAYRAIVNDLNTFTKKNDKECKRILKDAVDAFLVDSQNDETVDTKDIRTLSKMYEHALELFLGLVEFGHGAKVLNAAITGKSMTFNNEANKEKSFMDWVQKR